MHGPAASWTTGSFIRRNPVTWPPVRCTRLRRGSLAGQRISCGRCRAARHDCGRHCSAWAPVRIRRGTAADVPRALEIWRSAVDATHRFLSPEDRRDIDVVVAEQFLPNADLWLATDDADRPMGFMTMDGSAIDALFVDAAVHGQGYGTMLVEYAR